MSTFSRGPSVGPLSFRSTGSAHELSACDKTMSRPGLDEQINQSLLFTLLLIKRDIIKDRQILGGVRLYRYLIFPSRSPCPFRWKRLNRSHSITHPSHIRRDSYWSWHSVGPLANIPSTLPDWDMDRQLAQSL